MRSRPPAARAQVGTADDGGPSSEGWLCTAVGRGQQGGPRRPEGTASWRGGQTSHRGVHEGARASCKIFCLSRMFEMPRLGYSD